MNWEIFWDKKIREIAEKSDVILDVGGGRKFQKGMKKYEILFKNKKYLNMDMVAEYKPDILGDIKSIPLDDNSVDAIICKAVLEHIDDPFKAVAEMYRVLRPGGVCLVSLPFIYPYHASKGYYGDYFRFTKEGVRFMFNRFSQMEIVNIRGLAGTIINFFPIKTARKILLGMAKVIDAVIISENQVSGFNVFLKK
ncbi:SAM-dependent methyltransferase [Candidatus Parcubacteria bacterium]|nr:MAG: SAM-dependent methyltransferase [Candidatus Parcubacteria bacterium]